MAQLDYAPPPKPEVPGSKPIIIFVYKSDVKFKFVSMKISFFEIPVKYMTRG